MTKKEVLYGIGRRVLVKANSSVTGTPFEVKIMEISPSNMYVKIKYNSDITSWVELQEYDIVEFLLEDS